jgi:cytoskeletal protein CcmA (bactofilin family)
VAAEAKSFSCRHCNARVITEAHVVKGYVAVRRFATANRIRVTRKGMVYASVRAEDLEVDGVLEGDVVSLGGIRVGRHAKVKADLRGLTLSVEPGATVIGMLRIGPDQVPENESPAT